MYPLLKSDTLHAVTPVAFSRYFALYLAQIGWVVLGVYLYQHAFWPSICRPHGVVEVFKCSPHLADQRGWVESGLMTWLWSTPMLIGLEISRRLSKPRAKKIQL
jgi:hypothetical protein